MSSYAHVFVHDDDDDNGRRRGKFFTGIVKFEKHMQSCTNETESEVLGGNKCEIKGLKNIFLNLQRFGSNWIFNQILNYLLFLNSRHRRKLFKKS